MTILDALYLAALDLMTGIGIALIIAAVAMTVLVIRQQPRGPRVTVNPVYVREREPEFFEGELGWPDREVGPTAESHLGKIRLPDGQGGWRGA